MTSMTAHNVTIERSRAVIDRPYNSSFSLLALSRGLENPLCEVVHNRRLIAGNFRKRTLQRLVFAVKDHFTHLLLHARVGQVFLPTGILLVEFQDMESETGLDDLWECLSGAHFLNGLSQSRINIFDGLKRLEGEVPAGWTRARIFRIFFSDRPKVHSALHFFQKPGGLRLRLLGC